MQVIPVSWPSRLPDVGAMLCCWRMDRGDRERADTLIAWSVGPGEATRLARLGVRGLELDDVAFEKSRWTTELVESRPGSLLQLRRVVLASRQARPTHRFQHQFRQLFFFLEESGAQCSSEMQSENRSNRTPSNCHSLWPLQVPCDVVVTQQHTSPLPKTEDRQVGKHGSRSW